MLNIKRIQDIMRTDTGVDGDAQRIAQLTWMLFLKIIDDKELEYELDDKYRSPIPEQFRWRNWAANAEGMTGDELIHFINNNLFPALAELLGKKEITPQGRLIGHIINDTSNFMKSGILLRQVINEINNLNYTSQKERHLFNDVYETILKDLQSAGNAGEYYTPRAVTQFMVDMVDPKLGETVLDPACGTGGFLVCAYQHIHTKYVQSVEDNKLLQQKIRGVEKKPLPYTLCVTNLIAHGIEVPGIEHDNSLSHPIKNHPLRDKVHVIVTNPPFGGKEEDGIENNFPAAYKTKETADLFLYMLTELLQPGGRAAVVLPDGFLFGEGVKTRLKEKLLSECNLHTIVRLPNGVFSPYTGINTNLLFFTKGEPTQDIWYFEHRYPEGYKSYSKTKPIRIEEFDVEKEWWNNREENEQAWKVSLEQLQANNYNLDSKNPNVVDEAHRKPAELLEEYQKAAAKAQILRDELKQLLAAVGRSGMNIQYLFDHFDLLAQAPGCVDKLKETILTLAMQGKLVPQNPTDEPASELLKRIRVEKQALIADGKLKKDKPLPPITATDIPYDLPPGWEWVRLGNITEKIHYGYTASAVTHDTGTKLLRITDIQEGRVNWETVPFCEISSDKISGLILHHNDIVIARTGGTIGKSFIIKHPDAEAVFASYLIRLILFKNLIPNFIKIFLDTDLYWQQLLSYSQGTGQPNVNASSLGLLVIPIPPLAEQQRIILKVEELFTLCDNMEAALVRAENRQTGFMQSVLHHIGNSDLALA